MRSSRVRHVNARRPAKRADVSAPAGNGVDGGGGGERKQGGSCGGGTGSEAGIAMAVSVALIIRASTWDNGWPHSQPASQPGTLSPPSRPPSFEPLDVGCSRAATLSLQTAGLPLAAVSAFGGREGGSQASLDTPSLAHPFFCKRTHERALCALQTRCLLLPLLCDKGAARRPGLHFPTRSCSFPFAWHVTGR